MWALSPRWRKWAKHRLPLLCGGAAAIVLSIMPTLALALYAQKWLVEGLSLGAVKG